MKNKFLVAAFSIVLLSWARTADAQCSTYGGRATVVRANVANITPVILSDTGYINSTGDVNDASLLNASVLGLLSGEVLSATAGGEKSFSDSVASMANLNLTVAGNSIGVDFLVAHANASCASGSPTVNGSAEIDGLVVNALSIAVTGSPNQTVSLLGGGYIVLNEQTSSVQGPNGSITVNAIHVTVPGLADVAIASGYAAVSIQLVGASGGPVRFVGLLLQDLFIFPPCSPTSGFPCLCTDFFTGGGWIPPSETPSGGGKGTFGVSGGVHPSGKLFAHLEYHDHGTGMNVHGTDVKDCLATSPNSRRIDGIAQVNGQDGHKYAVDVTDNDDPGGTDSFNILLPDFPSTSSPYGAGGQMSGGDIEIHH